MRPLLNPSDQVGVEWLSRSGSFQLRPGEIVLGRMEQGDWTVHRVIGRPPGLPSNSWITKGDAAFASEILSAQQIWGRVVAIKPSSATARETQVEPKAHYDEPKAHYDEPKAHAIEYHWLDGWIALLSKWSLPPERLRAKLTRRLLRVSARLRRRLY
jgi:hypothetical protein